MIASQIAWHGRKAYELGIVTQEAFNEELKDAPYRVGKLPKLGEEVIFMKSGYAAHIHQAQPPKDALAYPLPKHWDSAEQITIKDVRLLLMHQLGLPVFITMHLTSGHSLYTRISLCHDASF